MEEGAQRTGRRESGAHELVGGEEDSVTGHLARERRREAAEEAAHALLAPHLAHHTDWPAAHTRTQTHLASAISFTFSLTFNARRAARRSAHKRSPENNWKQLASYWNNRKQLKATQSTGGNHRVTALRLGLAKRLSFVAKTVGIAQREDARQVWLRSTPEACPK